MRFIVHNGVATTGLTQGNASTHLCCLWDCGLVARERQGRDVHYRLISGVEELLAAADGVVALADQTVGACPNFGSGDEHGDVCDGVETVAEHADVTCRHDRMWTAVPGGGRTGPPTWSPADMDDKGA